MSNHRSNVPVLSLVAGLMCLGASVALPMLGIKIALSVAGIAGLVVGIIGIVRMK
ncbi:hypothetical protein ACF3MZ_04085 [Paenibacillaceae bacterium WGS1546]|uniref:hypothetical protein n=1 Tax=Cohnella sp. WGS1546 TaxID=3366810 RepID=UPI00372D6A7A